MAKQKEVRWIYHDQGGADYWSVRDQITEMLSTGWKVESSVFVGDNKSNTSSQRQSNKYKRRLTMNTETLKVYLCGPINGCTDEEATNWRESVKQYFPASIDPMKRDYRGVEKLLYREIVDLDKRDIRNSDIILVNYDKPSVGTSMEVFYAWTLGIPVVVWCREDAKLSPWLIYHSTSLVHSLEDVVKKIGEIA